MKWFLIILVISNFLLMITTLIGLIIVGNWLLLIPFFISFIVFTILLLVIREKFK